MVDVENLIFNAAYPDVAPLCAKNGYRSIHTPTPTVFPTVTLFEMDNRTVSQRRSSNMAEEYALLTYEAHIYATSKAECRKVFAALDNRLTRLNLNRMSGAYAPSTSNTKAHEYVARYRVEADQNGTLYRPE